MSDWSDHFEPEVRRLLESEEFSTQDHHFGHPYVSVYQLAAALERDNRELCQRLNKVIGEQKDGKDNLARYLSYELSYHIKNNPDYRIEGVWLSGKGLPALLYRHDGVIKEGSPNGDYGSYSLYRLKHTPE